MNHRNLPQQTISVTLVVLLLVGCGAPAATPTPVVIVVTATPQATATPGPPTATLVPTLGKLEGILVEKSTQKPIAAVHLQLTPFSRNAEGDPTWDFHPNNPRAETDESGNFSFSGVAPGEYSIWAHFTPTTFPSPITDDSGHTLVFEVKADQVLNVGKVLVEKR